MTQLVSLTAASPAPAPAAPPPASRADPCARFRVLEATRPGDDDVARWEDDGGAVLRPAELAA